MWIRVLGALILAALGLLHYQVEIPTLEQADRERFAARYDRAADLYARILASNPRDAEAHYGRVVSLIRAKRSREAYSAADQAMRHVPDTAGGQAAAGMAAFRGGDIVRAEGFFRAARKLSAQHPGALFGLAMVNDTVSNAKSNRELMSDLLKTTPGDPEAIVEYAESLKGSEHIATLERALSILDPTSSRAQRLRAHIASDRAVGDRKLRELASPYESSTIKLQWLSASLGTSIRAQLNERDSVTLLLDTGASGVSLSPRMAKKVALEKLSEEPREVTGFGDQKAPSSNDYLASQLRVGSVVLRNIPINVTSAVERPGRDGIIGTDVFRAFLVTLDFPKMEMRLDPRPGSTGSPPEGLKDAGPLAEGYTRVIRIGNHFTIPTFLNQSKTSRLFLIDSGASSNLIDTTTAREVTGVYADYRTRGGGVQGETRGISRADRIEYRFAGLRQTNTNIISIDLEKQGDSFGLALGGVIGMPTLGVLRMTFDYFEGSVKFEYK